MPSATLASLPDPSRIRNHASLLNLFYVIQRLTRNRFRYCFAGNQSLATASPRARSPTRATTPTTPPSTGKYGPYAAGASDGRQTLTRGKCVLLDETIVKSQLHADQVGGIEGGAVFIDRITDIGTNPSETATLAAFPLFQVVR